MSTNEVQGNADSSKIDTKQKTEMLRVPVFSLFIRTIIPLIIGLLINKLYNFVDVMFISRAVGTAATGLVSTLLNSN
jgi:Na+-driven multidrug efflux pump